MLVIVDYGVGNLASIANMLKKIGVQASISSDDSAIRKASKLILPGVGAFDHCMTKFNASGLRPSVTERVLQDKIPTLGICVGLQMLTEGSEEGSEPGLGWIKGKTVRFHLDQFPNLKIPHMGWTEVKFTKTSSLTKGLETEPRFYFVHSYHVQLQEAADQLLSAHYGYDFSAGIEKGNIFGVQFHPEKSHKFGMKILENFSGYN